jgi:hypothetical protein
MKKPIVSRSIIPSERIEQSILFIRGQKVMLDEDLAKLYDVETKKLIQAVRRNIDRFPFDFMFQVSKEEFIILRSQFATSNKHSEGREESLRSQIVTSKKGRGGRRHLPYVFTEQGVFMLSSVLRSKRAVAVNVEIIRAFVRLRRMLESHKDLAKKLSKLEKKYDAHFKVVFDAIRKLMTSPDPKRPPIGFKVSDQVTSDKF